ncbi:hypothetical protein J6590_051952 [Homalodisca vitripennis]|nr:hypothetical protein J6590_051952 [Homalodisca vitripennis]
MDIYLSGSARRHVTEVVCDAPGTARSTLYISSPHWSSLFHLSLPVYPRLAHSYPPSDLRPSIHFAFPGVE